MLIKMLNIAIKSSFRSALGGRIRIQLAGYPTLVNLSGCSILFLLFFAVANAQSYQISFAGTGASTTVDSVKVENLTQGSDITLRGSDTLYLTSIGINETDLNPVKGNNMHIYPNPMTGNCSVDFEVTAQGKTTLNLYNITGKRILQTQGVLSKGRHTYSLSGLSSGIYILKIKLECGSSSKDKYSYIAKVVSNNSRKGIAEIKYVGITPQSTVSNTGKVKSSKGVKSVITMQYTTGDRLKITGESGVLRTIFMLIPSKSQTVTFNFIDCTDADGNHYAVVQIGTQVWMVENLKATKYRDGSSIPNVAANSSWAKLTTGAYCNSNNDTVMDDTYGYLYNWYVVGDSRNICPVGWHIPADSEWTILTNYLGAAGGKMKEVGITCWLTPNAGATNESGFSALPSGCRDTGGSFSSIGTGAHWWSSSMEYNAAWGRSLSYSNTTVLRFTCGKICGFGICCVKD
ncbi:MAG: FISUMP domain-containing protein [bacterium]|nr:FISUMP domain-containing protein [bacterium]